MFDHLFYLIFFYIKIIYFIMIYFIVKESWDIIYNFIYLN
jgi:hypothetical protein